MSRPDEDDFDDGDELDEFDEFDEFDELMEECGLGHDGQCSMAGTEHCDFICPMRDSEDFAGSKAWNEKHKTKEATPLPLVSATKE